jgi:predicted deacetylase
MREPRERLLLASIHDVSPRFESEVDALMDVLRPHVGERLAMLVVPNHWGSAPITHGTPFAARLRAWAEAGIEMFLHGFYHRDDSRHEGPAAIRAKVMTAGEGEFLGLSREEAAQRIASGTKLLEDVIGRKTAGFIAPAWLYGAGALEALAQANVPLAEDHFSVWSPASGEKLAKGPVITWASRTKMRLASSLAAATALRRAPLEVLRIGVHPPDIRHPALVRSIDKTFRTASRHRRAASYRDLLPSNA